MIFSVILPKGIPILKFIPCFCDDKDQVMYACCYKQQFLNFYTYSRNLQGSLDVNLIMFVINGLCTKEV